MKSSLFYQNNENNKNTKFGLEAKVNHLAYKNAIEIEQK